MRNTGENEEHLGKMRYTLKSAAHLEKCTTLGKMQHTWKNATHFVKWGTLGYMHHPWKKVWYPWKNTAHSWKMGHNLRNAPLFKKC